MGIEPRSHEIERDGPVIMWKFSNPPRNLRTFETGDELIQLVEEFDEDPDLRVGIFTSAVPGMFIQHFDVSLLVDWAENLNKMSEEDVTQMLASFPRPRGMGERTSKPIICAINGPIEGGGCETALSFDFRFISRDAYMGQPEVQAGIIPGDGGSQRLARMVGMAKALELCLTGRRIYADEAERLGLVVKACDPAELMPTAMAFAKGLAALPPEGVALNKRAIYEGIDMTLPDSLVLARKLFVDSMKTEDALRIMRLYVAAGQDREKLQAMLEEQGG